MEALSHVLKCVIVFASVGQRLLLPTAAKRLIVHTEDGLVKDRLLTFQHLRRCRILFSALAKMHACKMD